MRRQFVQKMPMVRQRVGVAAFSPKDISHNGLVLWLAANNITGLADNDSVAQWDDFSGENNHATQATGGSQPTYKTGILNGQPSVRFDGSSDFLNVVMAQSPPYTVITVCRTPANDGSVRPWIGQPPLLAKWSQASRWIKGYTPSGGHFIEYTDAAYIDSNVITSLLLNPSGTSSQLYFNGGYKAGASITHSSISNFDIGRSPHGYYSGDIHEIIIYDHILSAINRGAVEKYLSDKYGIALTT